MSPIHPTSPHPAQVPHPISGRTPGEMTGLVLTAGGARGAYQAGVMKRVGEIPALQNRPSPFPIITGASAGAINSVYLASRSENFTDATRQLAEFWSALSIKDVFRTDLSSLGSGAVRWIRDLSLGGIWGGGEVQSLLDASPLQGFLSRNLPLSGIDQGIKSGNLYAVAISATSYYSGKSITFVQGQAGHPLWNKIRRVAVSSPIKIEHVMASCAIPVIFQPVMIPLRTGDFYFGDGALRLTAPMSPAIRLGANRVFSIGIRSHAAAMARSHRDLSIPDASDDHKYVMQRPPLAQVFGVTLNSIFLDHLDTDLDHLIRINDLIAAYEKCFEQSSNPLKPPQMSEPMRRVMPFVIHPSIDLAEVALTHSERMPRFVRYLMEGLGTSHSQSADLLSYLLFDSRYIQDLINVGYQDAQQRVSEIEEFLCAPSC